MEDRLKQTIIERHTVEVEPGVKKLDLVSVLLELEARIKTTYTVIDDVKEIIQGFGIWSKEIEERLDEIKPKIKIASLTDYNNAIKGL